MGAYLFVHFREKTTPDGEQVYFGLSRDGFAWEAVNGGAPVLWTYYGKKGVRDFTIVRHKDGRVFILATDLSLSYGTREYKKNCWEMFGNHGSINLSVWESEDLVNWTEQRLAPVGTGDMGCVWAPDVIYDAAADDYVLHWSSSSASDGYREKGIYYSRTKDFTHFSKPQILYKVAGQDIIDSAMYEEGGKFYLFVKRAVVGGECRIIELVSDRITGPFAPVSGFDAAMDRIENGLYEAPTAVKLDDGRWCLFLDFYGARGAGQGYVPFVAENLAEGRFVRADEAFSFPYGFKHGTILKISDEEYARIKAHDWSDKGYDGIA